MMTIRTETVRVTHEQYQALIKLHRECEILGLVKDSYEELTWKRGAERILDRKLYPGWIYDLEVIK